MTEISYREAELTQTDIPATVGNMRTYYAPGVFAWSPFTGEQVTANPADLFYRSDDYLLTDDDGNGMILVRKVTEYVNPEPAKAAI